MRRKSRAAGLPFVEDGVEPRLSEGAGSIAVELLGFAVRLDAVLVSLGNGAILGGMERWIAAHVPGVELVGVAPSGAPCMAESFRHGRLVATETIDTIADGMATRVPVAEALEDLRGTVGDVVLVDDAALIRGMRLVHRRFWSGAGAFRRCGHCGVADVSRALSGADRGCGAVRQQSDAGAGGDVARGGDGVSGKAAGRAVSRRRSDHRRGTELAE
jgi:threonine dehydratase